MEEKRKFVRLNLNVEVRWRKIIETLDRAVDNINLTKDISGGGIRLIVDETVKVADKLSLEIKLPTDKVIYCQGRVIWVEKFEIVGRRHEDRYEAGIEFMDISDDDREEISKLVFSFLCERR